MTVSADDQITSSEAPQQTLTIIVPVYFNEESLTPLHEELCKIEPELESLGLRMKLIFVDDGSGDQSLPMLLDIQRKRPDTVVVKLTRNFGAVNAAKAGFSFVDSDCFVLIAADLQDPVDKLPEMARFWREGHKLVLLVRERRGDPLLSKLASSIYYALLRKLVFSDYPKKGFDVAMMDRAMLSYVRNSGKNVNPNLFAYYLGFKAKQIPYIRARRRFGRSRWTFAKKVRYFLDSILGFSILPLRMAMVLGLTIASGSFLYAAFVVVSTLIKGSSFPGFPTIVSLLAFVSGVSLFVSGMIGEYVWRVFDEINKRPEWVVDEVFVNDE
ncbi:MAG: glycosyltransferase [Alphaproteobacteria bacterium]|nr:glycosyltransferase [Alphaproteobacteria bacterium]